MPKGTSLRPDVKRPWLCGRFRLHLSRRVHLMGIVNVTPDSFSDGGRFLRPDRAVSHGLQLIEAGADVLDVGGESTRPGADPVPEEEEIGRVLPVVERLAKAVSVPISVDTTKGEVARRALEAGASIINDISALRMDARMTELVRRSGCGLILMHMKGTPQRMQRHPHYRDLMGEIRRFLDQRMEEAVAGGILREQIVLDPGIGFGKTARHNLTILHRLQALTTLGRPLLVGPSRKSFIGRILDRPPEGRLEGTAAAVAAAVLAGAGMVRVHDVAFMRQVVRVSEAIARERLSGD